jgi:hypothetical protein
MGALTPTDSRGKAFTLQCGTMGLGREPAVLSDGLFYCLSVPAGSSTSTGELIRMAAPAGQDLIFQPLRWVAEVRHPAELGTLSLVFFRHLPQLASHVFVAGEVCVPCAHHGEVKCFTIGIARPPLSCMKGLTGRWSAIDLHQIAPTWALCRTLLRSS